MANDKSIARINAEHELAKRRESGSRRGTRKYRQAETARAEAFIENAVGEVAANVDSEAPESTPKARKPRAPKEYTFTAERMREVRESGGGMSWANVAKELGLPNPGAARRAWADLTGTPHTTAAPIVNRAPKGSGESARGLNRPQWDDVTDRQAIVDRLEGATITVKVGNSGATETLRVTRVTKFDDSVPERPAVVFTEGLKRIDQKTGEKILDHKLSTGATRTIFLDRILEVR